MKKSLLLILLVIGSIGYSQLPNSENFNEPILENALQVIESEKSSIPKFIEFRTGFSPALEDLSSFLNQFSKNTFTLVEKSRNEDQIGYTHIKFQQVINNIPLEFNVVTAHVKNGIITSISGNLEGKLPSINTAVLTEKIALKKAMNTINAKTYKWQIAEEEAHIKTMENNPKATYYPKGELVYFANESGLYLTYKFNIYAHSPVSRAEYFVDALSGKVLFQNKIIKHADVPGLANTGYSGAQVITTDSTSPTNYRLRETGRGLGIETYDCNNGINYGAAVDFTDSNNNWTSTANGDQYALDAHWGAEMTYDYFWNVHARNSIDGAGFKLISYIHYDNNYVNAFWNGNYMTYGDGNGTNTSPLTTLAIAGHEISHGLTTNTAALVYQNESGALNESFSDIFGVCIDYWARPAQANWLMGDEIYLNSNDYFRSMSNPNAKGDPDTYGGTNYYTGTLDNGGVHTNSGVQNFWFYLMVNGGTGTNDLGNAYSVLPLGFDTASRIAFRNLTTYLTPSSDHNDARNFAIQSAIDLYGACSPAVIATTNAWHAVGVGTAYVAGVQSDFTSYDTAGCKLPHTVTFTNTSNNATAFIWDFGDGSSSTALNPTHTYTGYGPYSVELYANGGACGEDTILKTTYITIDTTAICPDIMSKNSNLSSSACIGTLIDDGGTAGDYSNQQNSYFTISPTLATSVTLNFAQFDVESGDQGGTICNYDYLEVYDGTSTSAPLIGRYCNNNPPPASVTSSAGNLYIKFHSDQGVEEQGFILNWSCTQYTSPLPLALFTSSDTSICENESVTYTNNSVNTTSFSWSFPGGSPATSTAANPLVSYANSGSYTTRLIATNANGNDTIYQTINIKNICTVILPNGGTAQTRVSCEGKIIDNGGLSGNYSARQTTFITVSPLGANNVTFIINSFEVEADTNCIYDYLKIYDGPSVNSNLIGKYCNLNPPPSTISSTGGSLTLEFYADNGLQLAGFDIDWKCYFTSIEEVNKISKINIYPNPTNDYVNIDVDFNRSSELNLKVIDLLGKVLYQNTPGTKSVQFSDRIDVSRFAAGTYVIYVNNEAYKFIKQ